MELHPLVYNWLIDPLLSSSRVRIMKYIGEGQKVIDIASGTGELARDISLKADLVTGIDIEDSMIDFARKKLNGKTRKNVTFEKGDARMLVKFPDKSFDLAIMSMALHQFNPSHWKLILKETNRISHQLIILDYSYPLPAGYKKAIVHFIERLAGKEHSQNFRSFNKSGGVIPIVEKHGYSCSHSEISGSGIFTLYTFE